MFIFEREGIVSDFQLESNVAAAASRASFPAMCMFLNKNHCMLWPSSERMKWFSLRRYEQLLGTSPSKKPLLFVSIVTKLGNAEYRPAFAIF